MLESDLTFHYVWRHCQYIELNTTALFENSILHCINEYLDLVVAR